MNSPVLIASITISDADTFPLRNVSINGKFNIKKTSPDAISFMGELHDEADDVPNIALMIFASCGVVVREGLTGSRCI